MTPSPASHDTAFPDLSNLAAMALNNQLDVRPVLLRVQTDVFVSAPSRTSDMIRAYELMATSLVPAVDAETAAIVARKLAPQPDAPAPVLDALYARGGAVAAIIVAQAHGLSADKALAIATGEGAALALALADRAELHASVIDALLDRDEPAIDERLAANSDIRLNHNQVGRLLMRGRHHPALAEILTRRSDLSGADKASLFAVADDFVRDAIIADAERLAALAGHTRERRPGHPEDIEPLIAAGMRGDKQALGQCMAGMFGCAAAEMQRILAEPTGELLAIALVALGVPEEDGVRVFLRLDPQIAQSIERVFALADMMRRVSPAAARRIVGAVLGVGVAAARPLGMHVPVMAPGGVTSRAGVGTQTEPVDGSLRPGWLRSA